MVYDLASLQSNVRALFSNVDEGTYPSAQLESLISLAKAQLDNDYPAEAVGTLAAQESAYYNVSSLTGWTNDLSVVREVLYPVPDLATREHVYLEPLKFVQAQYIGGAYRIRLDTQIQTGKTAQITYTVPWTIIDLDGATTSNMTNRAWTGLSYLAASRLASALATKYAGEYDSQVPGDVMAFKNKAMDYERRASAFEKLYWQQTNQPMNGKPAPFGGFIDIDVHHSDGEQPITHRPARYR